MIEVVPGLWGFLMMIGSRCLRSFAIAALVVFGSLTSAPAAGWLEKSFYLIGPRYDGVLPPCEAGLETITYRFAQKEGRFWNSSLQIVGYERVREIAFRPWAPDTIPRRFCTAVATVTDGRKHTVNYSIGEDTNMIGMFWGVEWCVVGLDRNWAYNPACKMARP